MKASSRPLLWCLLAAVLFGASTPASKTLLDTLNPFALAGLLYLGAALAVAPASFRAKTRPRFDRRNLLRLGGAVVFGGVLGPVLLLLGLKAASASSGALWLNLETPATGLIGWLFFKEHVDRRAGLAIGLVIAASLLLAAPFDLGSLRAVGLVAAGCLCWGLDNNLTAVIDDFTPSQSTFAKGLVAGSVNLVLALAFTEGIASGFPTIAGALVVGAFAYGISLVLYVAGAQQLGATRSQAIFATSPFWGVAMTWVFLAEPITGLQLAAGGMMIVAVVLMHKERHGHRHSHSAQEHNHWHRHDDGHHTHVHPGVPAWFWHCHEHGHEAVTHVHEHRPDLHHRHDHHHDDG